MTESINSELPGGDAVERPETCLERLKRARDAHWDNTHSLRDERKLTIRIITDASFRQHKDSI
ncbi:hypothetical protein FRB94_004008 [Tulasnella sp. JGI-2019a]|nr:hypothetical protein FRB94_004008 [Tulasnella sp. JGI-2019a]